MAESTAEYYRKNPEARRKRRLQQKIYNKTNKGLKIRVAANAANRAKGTYGNGDGLDVAHKKGKEGSHLAKDVDLKKPKTNRRSRLKSKHYA